MHSSILGTYKGSKLSFVKGRGSYLITKGGKKYLDFASGIAVNSLGHCNPELIKALYDQSKKIWHTSNAFKINEQEKLANKLTNMTDIGFDQMIRLFNYVKTNVLKSCLKIILNIMLTNHV